MTSRRPELAGLGFLEAKRLAAGAAGAELPFFLGMSGTAEPLVLYLQAAVAERGRVARVTIPSFGTLAQTLRGPTAAGRLEAMVILPWDLVPEADWRTGVGQSVDLAAALASADREVARLTARVGNRLVYVAAPVPPIGATPETVEALGPALSGMMAAAGATLLGADCFSLSSYLSSGNPIAGGAMGKVARAIAERLLPAVRQPAKVLVTDFDNTLWAGVLSEDGEHGIAHQASGRGFRHFIYQTLLARLKANGTLIAGVTRNSASVVEPVIARGEMVLKADDFVAVLASYHAKSSQIDALAKRLNLGLDSFVFVDDNEVELEEVTRALPGVRCLRFPAREEDLPALLSDLADRFARDQVTAEDRERTTLYRRRLDGIVPEEATGADIGEFLGSLGMRLELADRSRGDRTRVVQLINKTNQFNLNGRRWTDEEIGAVLAAGGRLLGATLTDRSGSHGEIISLLMSESGTVEAWVMSCRVFQRRVEFGFLLAALERGLNATGFRFAPTDRNEPIVRFLEAVSGPPRAGVVSFDSAQFCSRFGSDLRLFEVQG